MNAESVKKNIEYFKCPICKHPSAYGSWRKAKGMEGHSTCPKCKTIVKDTRCRKCNKGG